MAYMCLVAASFLSSPGLFPICVNILQTDSILMFAACVNKLIVDMTPNWFFFMTLSRVQALETNWNKAHFQINLTDSDRPRGSPEKAHLVPSISSLYQPLSLLRLQPLRLGADLHYSRPTAPSLPALPPPLVQRPLSAQHSQIRKCPNGRSYVLL